MVMDTEVAQLVEMGATPAQARAALRKYKDLMRAAEKFFDGEFADVMDDDGAEASGASIRGPGRAESSRRMMTPENDDDDGNEIAGGSSDIELEGYDDDDDGFVDYDSDDGSKPAVTVNSAADPYAGIFFSKDRRETVIEVEENPEIVQMSDYSEPLKVLTQGQWMKGCPEGSEQTFLFTIYTALGDGVCRCPEGCGYSAPRSKGDFFAIYPTFASYVTHVRNMVRRACPNCQASFCFACGERVTKERDHNGRLTLDENPLFHCSNLQGILLGVGLSMLEQEFNAQLDESSSSTPGNPKKRKAKTPKSRSSSAAIANSEDDDDDEYYGPTMLNGKKPKAQGIGYAGNKQEDTTGQLQALRAQLEKDKKIGTMLADIREFLPNLKRPGGGKTSDYLPHPTALAHLRRRFNCVSSALLRNDSLSDMSDRSVLYFELFLWLETISNHESLASMMAMPIMVPASVQSVIVRKNDNTQVRERTIIYEGSSGPRELLESIVIQATAACKGLEGCDAAIEISDQPMTEEEKRVTYINKGKEKEAHVDEKDRHQYAENNRLREFCQRIIATAEAIDRSLRDTKGIDFVNRLKASLPTISSFDKSSRSNEIRTVGVSDEERQKLYLDWASRVRFEYCDLTVPPPEGAVISDDYIPTYKHYFNADIRLLGNSEIPKRALAIAKELAVLTTNLPVAWDSSIFLRVDESRVDVIKALITGPPGTPYHNGCYVFDIFLGSGYNGSPPSVKYMTTNGGKYRFNPNLYADGKVCLSLLGTWSGPGWIAGKSTLLQVLISIQSMILCDEPYLNEPGWANEHGTPASKAYSANVRRMVVNTAMLENLKSPPEPFEDIIRTHFKLKSQSIKTQLDTWLKEDDWRPTVGDNMGMTLSSKLANKAASKSSEGSSSAFRKDVDELKALLTQLEIEDAAGPSSSKA